MQVTGEKWKTRKKNIPSHCVFGDMHRHCGGDYFHSLRRDGYTEDTEPGPKVRAIVGGL